MWQCDGQNVLWLSLSSHLPSWRDSETAAVWHDIRVRVCPHQQHSPSPPQQGANKINHFDWQSRVTMAICELLFPLQEVVLLPRELLPEQGGVGRGSHDIYRDHACGLLCWDSKSDDDLHEEGILLYFFYIISSFKKTILHFIVI